MRQFTRGSCDSRIRTGSIALFLLWNGVLAVPAQEAGSKPSNQPQAGPGIAVGSFVVLKVWDTPLDDDGRLVPSGYHVRFVVERVEGSRVLVASHIVGRRGWVHVDQVVPQDQAIAYFDGEIARDPRNANAYGLRGRLRLFSDRGRARADLDRAIQLEPTRAHYYVRGA